MNAGQGLDDDGIILLVTFGDTFARRGAEDHRHLVVSLKTCIYVVRQGGCDDSFVHTYVIILSRAWDRVGSQDEIRKRAEGFDLKSKSCFIRARIPQRHAPDLRNLQGLNPELPKSYIGNCPYQVAEKEYRRRAG